MTATGQTPASLRPHRARLRFERLPATYCHPERIAGLLPSGLLATHKERLQTSMRLRVRLSKLLAKRFDLKPCTAEDLATPEGRFAQLEGEDLENARLRIGAIWQARKIRKIILAEPLRRLTERLGRETYRTALRAIDLSPEDKIGEEVFIADDGTPDLDALFRWIDRDSLVAINAWCRHQPAALADRLRLKLPPCPEADDPPPTSHEEYGLIIVDRVVMALAEERPDLVTING